MIAPCKCTGLAKWVHRSCLDLWRERKDRSFAQCTECGFHYHFEPTDRTETQQFWRWTKFCLFVSRDLSFVTVAVQLLIGLLGLLTKVVDDSANLRLLHLLDGSKASLCANSSFEEGFLWCHHRVAVYYLYGLFEVLILLGIFGSCVLCNNGWRIPDLSRSENNTQETPLQPQARSVEPSYTKSETNHFVPREPTNYTRS